MVAKTSPNYFYENKTEKSLCSGGRNCFLKYLKLSYFSGILILAILVRGLVIAKFNVHQNFAITRVYCISYVRYIAG